MPGGPIRKPGFDTGLAHSIDDFRIGTKRFQVFSFTEKNLVDNRGHFLYNVTSITPLFVELRYHYGRLFLIVVSSNGKNGFGYARVEGDGFGSLGGRN